MTIPELFFREVILPSRLRSVGDLSQVLTLAELCEERVKYGIFESLDTLSGIAWHNHRFRIVPRLESRFLNPKYLEDSPTLGKVISLLDSEYNSFPGPELELVTPSDRPDLCYAIFTGLSITREYTLSEVEKLCKRKRGGIINAPMEIGDAFYHPVWLALFEYDETRLKDFLDQVENFDDELWLPINITDPGIRYPCVTLLHNYGLEDGFAVDGRKGFSSQRKFLARKS